MGWTLVTRTTAYCTIGGHFVTGQVWLYYATPDLSTACACTACAKEVN